MAKLKLKKKTARPKPVKTSKGDRLAMDLEELAIRARVALADGRLTVAEVIAITAAAIALASHIAGKDHH